ncbi:MAG: PIN domain-containing protein [Terriglobales bacterium]|jgi:predicted nucleic acid-binding protein
MVASALVDTGVILALVDRNDRWHEPCVEVYDNIPLPLLTTEAVLAEVFHLTYRNLRDVRGIWTLLRSGAIRMASIEHDELAEVRNLMEEYADRPMDFADATLVHLASREATSLILTIDHDDFETYRIGRRKKFMILPRRNSR